MLRAEPGHVIEKNLAGEQFEECSPSSETEVSNASNAYYAHFIDRYIGT